MYPNLGYFTNEGWRFDPGRRRRGVCGDGVAAGVRRARRSWVAVAGWGPSTSPPPASALRAPCPGTAARSRPRQRRRARPATPAPVRAGRTAAAARSTRCRSPTSCCDPGVVRARAAAATSPGSTSFREGTGAHQRCLDIGCGTGILTVQLALNGAAHVHAIDIDERAVLNTLTNAFRNGVAERMTAATVDLYPWVPEERYEVIVASLPQMPVDPFQQVSTHRPVDYWGRSRLDQLISKLPDALAPEGVAYLVQLSILSQRRTRRAARRAPASPPRSWSRPVPLPPRHRRSRTQIRRVEELSDAHHLRLGEHDVMVAYLLEVRRKAAAGATAPCRGSAAPDDRRARRGERARGGAARRRRDGPAGRQRRRACSPRIARSPGSSARARGADGAARPRSCTGSRAGSWGRGSRPGSRPASASGRAGAAGGARPGERDPRLGVARGGRGVGLDRVLLSRVQDGALLAEALHVRDDPEGARRPSRGCAGPGAARVPADRGRAPAPPAPAAGAASRGEPRRRRAHAAVMGWRDYVTAPIVLEGRVIGFLHGDRTATGGTRAPAGPRRARELRAGVRAHRRARDPPPPPADPAPGDAPGRDLGRRAHQRALRPRGRPRRRPRRRGRSGPRAVRRRRTPRCATSSPAASSTCSS